MFLSKRVNGIYYIHYKNSNKKRVSVSTGSKIKSEALKFLTAFKFKYKENEHKKYIDITLGKYFFHFLKRSESIHTKNTNEGYKITLRLALRYFGNIQLSELSKEQLLGYIDYRIRTCSIYSARKDLIYLSSAFNRAVEENFLEVSPSKGIKRIKIPEKQPLFYSKDDFSKLLSVITQEDIKDIVLFTINTGLRRAEVISLEWTQINLDNKLLTLDNRNHLTKSKRIRTIPLNPAAIKILLKRKLENNPLVFTIDGNRIKEDSLTNRFAKFKREADINQKLNFHSLRHSFASWLVQSDVSIYHVSKLLGHANVKTTEIYAHLRTTDLQNATELIQY